MSRTLSISLAALSFFAITKTASAQVFSEDWENGSGAWTVRNDATNAPIVIQSDTAICSSNYQHETVRASGGRVFTAAPLTGTAGDGYCLVAWVRGSTNTQPFIGFNHAQANGTPLTAPGDEHWLIGHTGYLTGFAGGDTVAAVASDGTWHWYAKSFTMPNYGNPTRIVIKDELFTGGAAGSADFDDIELIHGNCPQLPLGAAHVTCSGNTPVCTNGQCVACTSDSNCSGTTPACEPSGACGQCSTTNTSQCANTTPVCDTSSGTCTGCTSD
ncbi:MAG: hypothetical protein JST54_24630, partial [Deltaproteobacteria bacterium]|nr:hypothetical protein [Deltaproteobacteria bacterium]